MWAGEQGWLCMRPAVPPGDGYLKKGTDSSLPLYSHQEKRGREVGQDISSVLHANTKNPHTYAECAQAASEALICFWGHFAFQKTGLDMFLPLLNHTPVGLRSWAKAQVWEFSTSCRGVLELERAFDKNVASMLHQASQASEADSKIIYFYIMKNNLIHHLIKGAMAK